VESEGSQRQTSAPRNANPIRHILWDEIATTIVLVSKRGCTRIAILSRHIIHIGDKTYTYDANGNMTGRTHDVSGQKRKILWDEENRIRSISDNGAVHHYTYDASGERVLKGKSNGQAAYVNGEWTGGSGSMGSYTVYVNPYLVLKSGSYTKHFYIEGQRIVSKLGDGIGDATNGSKAGKGDVSYGAKQEEAREGIVRNLKWLGEDGALLTAGNSGKTPPG
jgi:YD repeat-containing protein